MRRQINKYQVMLAASIGLVVIGIIVAIYGAVSKNAGLIFGIAAVAVGGRLLGGWASKAYTYICMECYLRIDIRLRDILTAFPVDGECKRTYCPKCRKKVSCMARKISLKTHIY